MSTQTEFVVIGGGLAAAKAVEALRTAGFEGRITVVSEEKHRPYLRPPLSKDYLQGKATLDSLFVHPADWYRDQQVDLRLGETATSIQRATHTVTLSGSSDLHYDKLLLATGSRPRLLTLPGADLSGIHYLRRIEDSDAIRGAFARGDRVTIIGAGWIGLETAAAAREAGCDVTVVETASLPLVKVLGSEAAQVFADLHVQHGVNLRLGARLRDFTGNSDRVTDVRLEDGSEIPTDTVIVGVGIDPNVTLAEAAGIDVDDGVLVDEHLRSSDPDVFAVGDVANAYNPKLGKRIRVEHWANALHQPEVAALGMMDRQAQYDRLPYFYSDQYDVAMEYVGFAESGHYDQVVFRGDVPGRKFIAFWLVEGRVLAGMNVNTPDVVEAITSLIESGRRVDVARLADPLEPFADA
jgi:3-phenylpropionate/trans-cinnamate dioxygenase ferredoxin reductase subunit